MNDLIELAKYFGTPVGLLMFILYKEAPLWLKKRNGNWVDFKEIRNTLEVHVKEDKEIQNKISSDLAVYKAEQTQINGNLCRDVSGIRDNTKIIFEKIDHLTELILNKNGK